MKELFYYLLKSSLWIVLCWAIYSIFLKKEIFYKFNRFFLLFGVLASFVFPLLHYRYQITVFTQEVVSQVEVMAHPQVSESFNYLVVFGVLYLLGVCVIIVRHLFSLKKIKSFIRQSGYYFNGVYKLVDSSAIKSPFSIFNFIFINSGSISETEKKLIIDHEKSHVSQYHWVDLVVAEIVCILLWFNPFAWLYLKSIKENHEFLADKSVLQHGNSPALYQATLLNLSLEVPVFSLVNSFAYYNKFKRIAMMKKKSSNPIRKASVLLLIPFLALFFWAFSEPEYIQVSLPDVKLETQASVQQIGSDSLDVVVVGYRNTNSMETHLPDTLKTTVLSSDDFGSISMKINENGINSDLVIHTVSKDSNKDASSSIVITSDTIDGKIKENIHTSGTTTSSTQLGNKPLVILDGVEITYADFENSVKVEDIEQISILKDKSATGIYGFKGKDGVIVITTKGKKE